MSESNRHNDMGHTIDISHVHVGDQDAINDAGTWVCADTCPHPDHAKETRRSNL